MPAYCIGRVRIKDNERWDAYRSRVGATITQYGGTVLLRGAMQQAFSGAIDHDAVVVLQFATIDAARRWHDSAEYQALVPLRDAGAEVSLALYEQTMPG